MSKKIKIIICDDHEIVRKGIISLLNDYQDFEVIAESSNGIELQEKLKTHKPDIIILDLQMPGMNGDETLKMLSKKYPEIKVIIVSSFCNEIEIIISYIQDGASAVVTKENCYEDLAKNIIGVMTEGQCFSGKILKSLLQKELKLSVNKGEKLRPRELQILSLVCDEKSNKQIADILNLSPETIKLHKSNLYRKTNSVSPAGVVKYAYKRGWL